MSDQEPMPLIEPYQEDDATDGDDGIAKFNEVIEAVNNIARAVETMASWLVQAQTGFNAKDAEGIVRIVRGETKP